MTRNPITAMARNPVKAASRQVRRIRPWREWTLRTRLVMSMAVLAAIALIVANGAGVILLRSYLVNKVDQQLISQSNFSAGRFNNGTGGTGGNGGTGGAGRGQGSFRPPDGFGPDYRIFTYDATGTQEPLRGPGGFPASSQALTPGPELGGWTSIKAHANTKKPYTVPGADGAPWRVLVTPNPNGTTDVAAISLRDLQNTSKNLLSIDAIVTVLMLLIIGMAAASVVRIGLRPLTKMENTAAEIAGAEDLSRRVEDTDPHTESGRLGTALNAMLVRIEAALDARTASEQRLRQFLADASHELRTPLTSIQGFAELYRRGGTPPGPELDEAMGRIESETVRMRVLVNDLLQLARLDEERPIRQHPVDLLGVAAETVRDAHVRVPTRFVQLAALDDAFDTFEPVTVLGDDDRLRQVATNLVSNALQHTGENTQIVVRVGIPRAGTDTAAPTVAVGRVFDPSEPVAVLEVSDTGGGMTAEVAGRVFERLYRAERSRDRRLGGAGLGLAIVAGIVQAHGGRVELTTAPGAGSRFRVVLPAIPVVDDFDEEDDSELVPRNPSVPVESASS